MTRKRRADDATYTCGTAMSVYQRAWLTVVAILSAIGGAVVLIISPRSPRCCSSRLPSSDWC